MDLQQTYDYLARIRKAEYAIQRRRIRREELQSCLTPGGIRYDKDRVQSSPVNKFPDIIATIADLDQQIDDLLYEKAHLVIEVGNAIERLQNDNEKMVLSEHYIGRAPMKSISEKNHYSLRHTYWLRKRGAEHLGKLLESDGTGKAGQESDAGVAQLSTESH